MPSPRRDSSGGSRVPGGWSACPLTVMVAAACTAAGAWGAPIDDARGMVGTTWYTVSVMDQRVGYAYRGIEVDDGAQNGPVLRVVQKVEAQVKLATSPTALTILSEIVSTYDADLRLVSIDLVSSEFGRAREVRAKVRGDVIDVSVLSGGKETHETLPLPEEFGSEVEFMLRVVRGEARVGDRVEFETFSPELATMDRCQLAITEELVLEDGGKAFLMTAQMSRVPIEIETVIAEDGTVISVSTPSLLNLALVQASEEEALAVAAPLVLSSEIETNTDIGDPKRIDMLKVRISAGAQRAEDLIPATSRQSVEVQDDDVVVTITRLPFEGPSASLPITGEEFAPFLEPSETGRIDDPLIIAKAREIVGDEKDARRAAVMIVRWVYKNMKKVKSEPRPVSAREVLDEMGGDCTEHAVLTAALAGAVGIPAKMTAGLAYAKGAFWYHAWNELYVGEWVEMDSAFGELAVDAGHILLVSGGLDMESMARMGLAAGRCIGSLEIEVLDHHLEAATSDLPDAAGETPVTEATP